jgi:hypothetical protein
MCLDQIEKHFVFTSKLYHPRKRKKKKKTYTIEYELATKSKFMALFNYLW